ncbi:MAG TPA: TetR/AcrR family transcriptional regulator, partial [Thermoanaerobaculia bacterium]|nr:TetR/AcrR family transcriptional regulator [Thermoanaerobaculia bacterium]
MGRPPTISRDQILQAARVVFTEKGFAASTLADIAGELHVTPAALLRHFESKQALFDAAMRGSVALPACILRLDDVDASTDPRLVLRELAEEWIPFASKTIAQNVVITMHQRSNPTLVLPFDPRSEDSPPRRGEKILAGYFKRAKAAGVIDADDPRAAALLFIGSLVSYVFIHYVLRVIDPPYPVASYIDALIDLWTEGAISRAENRQTHHSRPRHRGGRDRPVSVRAKKRGAARAHPVGNAGSA